MEELKFVEFERIMKLLEEDQIYDKYSQVAYIKLLPIYNKLKNKKTWLNYNKFIPVIPKLSKRNEE